MVTSQPYVEPLDEDINWNHAVYSLGKLSDVAHALAVGEGDVRSRLRQAAPTIFSVVPAMVPSSCDVRQKIQWVHVALTRYPPADYELMLPPERREAAYEPTLRRIQNRTGAKIAGELFGAWLDLQSLVHHHQEGHFLSGDYEIATIIDDVPAT